MTNTVEESNIDMRYIADYFGYIACAIYSSASLWKWALADGFKWQSAEGLLLPSIQSRRHGEQHFSRS